MKPWMTADQIEASYRDAPEKTEQIKILCDLNACEPEQILSVLQGRGYTVDFKVPRYKKRHRHEDEIKKLYDSGCNDAQIAKAVGMSVSSIAYWRKDNGLPPVTKPAQSQWQAKEKDIVVMCANGYSDKDIARVLKMHPANVIACRNKYGIKSSWERNHDEMRRLYDRGMNDSEVAEQLHTSQSTVSKWRNGEKLPAIKKRRQKAG